MYLVNSQQTIGVIEGKKKVQVTIVADTASDLPEYNKCNGVDGELTLGSMAFVTGSGKAYAMTSNGTWNEIGGNN